MGSPRGDERDLGARRLWAKLGLLLASAAVSALLGWQVWVRFGQPSESGGSVVLVDQSAEIEALLVERRRSAGGGSAVASGGRPTEFRREAIELEVAQRFFPALTRRPWFFVPDGYYRPNRSFSRRREWSEHPDGGWTHHINSLGMLEESEPIAGDPDLRILVTGDSHTEGVCATHETFPNVLEELLREQRGDAVIEVLNAGFNGYNLYNYVGTLEAFLDLEPDLFIVCVYGGNDFSGMMSLQRYFQRREPPRKSPALLSALTKVPGGLAAQEFMQARYFMDNPEDVRVATWTLELGALEMQRICREHQIELMIVYLPPPTRGQPELESHWVEDLSQTTGIVWRDLGVSDRIADRWLAFLDERQILSLDLRPAFRAQEEPLYWQRDHHINVRAQRLIAAELLPIVEAWEAGASTESR